jgi:RNA polymerase sigma-70 factor (ECF subfamily)
MVIVRAFLVPPWWPVMTATLPGARLEAVKKERVRVLYEDHHDVVWRFLRRIGLDDAAAADVTHQTFLVAIARLDDIEAGKARSFLCGTALRLAKKAMSSARSREDLVEELPEIDTGARPDDQVEHQRRLRLLDATLRKLPEDLRVALVLHDLEGYSQREMAELLEIPDGTAASRLRRAREAFDTLLEAHVEREAP